MADYKVQMKQYNGTGFDNILPYASQALTLAGVGGATEIIAQARAGLSQIATGSYVGTGTYGERSPTVINCGFKPKVVFFAISYGKYYQAINYIKYHCDAPSGDVMVYGLQFTGWHEGISVLTSGSYPYTPVNFTATDTGLSFWTTLGVEVQNNKNGVTYYFIAIG